MGCFNYFRRRCKYRGQMRSAPTPNLEAGSPTSIKATSRSEESAIGNEASKSTVSIASQQRSIPELYQERAQSLRGFELKELRHATNDFSRLFKIGEGGFGSVYKGSIRPLNRKGDNIAVAIKKLNPKGLQGHKQWLAEVQFLGVVKHPNLVKLIGYCSVDDDEQGPQRLLVYEFVPNKTLEHHLFSRAYPSIPWEIRLQIALGAAEGLAYLHEGLEVQVIYRDLKASNVLLDEEFKPKLSDFGLARQGPSAGHTHVTTAVMGTYGYAAPDYIESGHLTAKSDVWSFGVVLYEILTGRRSMDRNRPRGEHKLLDWVKQFPVESTRFSLIMDPRLANKYSLRAARDIATLADQCLAKQAKDRPTMREVVEALKKAMQHKELDGQVEPVGNDHPIRPETDNKREQDSGLASTRRRMLHLSKLSENVNTNKRRFVLMKAANHY